MKINNYINERLKNNKDDRETNKKLNSDAKLRGNIGEKEANKIINMIDNYKSIR